MSLHAPRLGPAELADLPGQATVLSSDIAFAGRVWDVRRDNVLLADHSEPVVRDYVEHPGAVAVLALREDRGGPEIFLIRQYRHPVGASDWEIPAGLLDVPGEPGVDAARRELAEEADLVAARWEELVTFTPSPGGLSEVITVYLATDLAEVPEAERHARSEEEAGMPCGWVPLADAVTAVLGGRLRNAPMMLAVLALDAQRRRSRVN